MPLRFPAGLGVYKGLQCRHLLLKELQQPAGSSALRGLALGLLVFFSFYKKRNFPPSSPHLAPSRRDVMSAPLVPASAPARRPPLAERCGQIRRTGL